MMMMVMMVVVTMLMITMRMVVKFKCSGGDDAYDHDEDGSEVDIQW